jgi:serine/threonine protein kinase/WD40 repeat protein
MNPAVSSETDPLVAVVESFLQRYRRGERPSLMEYATRYPELAERIRETFPALAMIEELGSVEEPAGLAPAHEPIGANARLGDYRLLGVIGQGGMGVVYEAVQESLGRHVALKVLPHSLASRALYLERFERESRAAARLHHTNIVPVYGVGKENGTCYYAMQFIPGQGLEVVLEEVKRLRGLAVDVETEAFAQADGTNPCIAHGLLTGHFSPRATMVQGDEVSPPAPTAQASRSPSNLSGEPEARYFRSIVRLGLQVAEGLAHAHGQGVVHRDIKPSNLLLDAQGTLWITDFGLAKAEDSADLTRTGDIVGTTRYMAPERFKGKADARSDVYALGVTLYELLTLRPPFIGHDQAQLIGQIMESTPRPLRALAPAVPRDLETIVLKAMAREPAARYSTATALAADLRAYLENRPIQARRASTVERLRYWCRRNPLVAGLASLLATMALLVTLGSIVTAVRLERSAGKALLAERVATERLFRSSLAQAKALQQSEQMGRRWAALKAVEQAADLARSLELGEEEILPLRNEAIACLALPDVRIEPEWQGSPPGCVGLAFDSSYANYAQCSLQGRISLRRRAEDREIRSFRVLFPAGLNRRVYMGFSPGDRYLAAWFSDAARERPFYVWDLQNQTDQAVIELTDAASFWSFLRDETQVAVAGTDNSIRLYSLPEGKEAQRLPARGKPSRVAFHPSGRSLAVASQSLREVQILDLLSKDLLATLPHPAGTQALAWTPDGMTLATGCMDGHIYLWDAKSGSRRGDLQGHSAEVHDLSFSHGGDLLMSIAFDQTQRLWDPWMKKQLVTIPLARQVAFSRDNSFAGAIVQGNHVGLCSLVLSPEFRPFRADTGRVYYCDMDATGRLLVSSAADDVRLWDLADGSELALLDKRVTALFGPRTKCLLTYGQGKLQRWPIRSSNRSGMTRLHIGPEEDIFDCGSPHEGNRFCWLGQACQSVAICEERQTVSVIDLAPKAVRRQQWQFPACAYIASSPDGRWVAAGTYEGSGVRVWDAQSGELAREWEFGDADVAFSPDGRWLALTPSLQTIGAAECSFWRVGTWERGPAIALDRTSAPAEVAFSDDGRLVAVARSMTEIVLLDPTDLHELATLQSRAPLLIHRLQFSPDGGRLAVTMGKDVIAVWDLRLLWQELAQMGLGQGLPPLPPTAQTDQPLPLRVEVLSSTSQPPLNKPSALTSPPTTYFDKMSRNPDFSCPIIRPLGAVGK